MIGHAEIREVRCSCDPVLGQVVAWAIIPRPDVGEIYSGEVQDFCRKQLAGYKIPQGIFAVSDLPRFGGSRE